MEKELQKVVDELSNTPGVVGVVCADKQGMPLTASGVGKAEAAGNIVALSQLAASLEPGQEHPVLLFEGNNSTCMIHQNAGVTLAVYKTKTAA